MTKSKGNNRRETTFKINEDWQLQDMYQLKRKT